MYLCLAGFSAAAEEPDDEWGDEGDDVGFAETPSVDVEPTKKPFPARFGGVFRHDEGVWVERWEDDPVAKVRNTLDLRASFHHGPVLAVAAGHAEVDLLYMAARDHFDEATYRDYAWQARPDELYAALTLGPVDAAAGRQVVSVGEGLLLSPVDRLNPRDNREPGLADLEELRLPVTMVRVAAFRWSQRIEAIWVPETDFGYRTPPNGPFGPVPALLEESPTAPFLEGYAFDWVHLQKRWDLENSGLFGRWRYSGPGFDLGLVGGTLLDTQGVMALPDPLTVLEEERVDIALDHRRYEYVGHTGAAVVGKTLFRWELSADFGRAFDAGDVEAFVPVLEPAETTLVDAMAGFGFTGVKNTRFDLELRRGWFPERPEDLVFPVDLTVGALRAEYVAFRERLRISGVFTGFGETLQYGWLSRADVQYELRDGWKLKVGAITYQPGKERGPLLGLDTHDRLFGQLRVDF